MSVKIKGMNLSERCLSCPLYLLNEYRDRFCYASPETTISSWEAEFKRHDDCPMEELEE